MKNENNDKQKIRNKIIGVVLIVLLTYVALLGSLYKMTGKIEWTIVKSPALKELIILTVVFILIALIVHRVRKK